jgi:hypothetical protein
VICQNGTNVVSPGVALVSSLAVGVLMSFTPAADSAADPPAAGRADADDGPGVPAAGLACLADDRRG